MRPTTPDIALLVLLAAALTAAGPAAAAERRTSLEQAVSEARERYNGRVLSADTERRGGRETHRIRILTDDGRVKRLRVDPETGRDERRRGGR
jgi:uncharacterized membrane protein YkoI